MVDVGIIYNQFSPNGDRTNDYLKINRTDFSSLSVPKEEVQLSYSIEIFNRYGKVVFEGKNMTEEIIWDGTWKGEASPEGTYFYILDLSIGGSNTIQKGWIQLIR